MGARESPVSTIGGLGRRRDFSVGMHDRAVSSVLLEPIVGRGAGVLGRARGSPATGSQWPNILIHTMLTTAAADVASLLLIRFLRRGSVRFVSPCQALYPWPARRVAAERLDQVDDAAAAAIAGISVEFTFKFFTSRLDEQPRYWLIGRTKCETLRYVTRIAKEMSSLKTTMAFVQLACSLSHHYYRHCLAVFVTLLL